MMKRFAILRIFGERILGYLKEVDRLGKSQFQQGTPNARAPVIGGVGYNVEPMTTELCH